MKIHNLLSMKTKESWKQINLETNKQTNFLSIDVERRKQKKMSKMLG